MPPLPRNSQGIGSALLALRRERLRDRYLDGPLRRWPQPGEIETSRNDAAFGNQPLQCRATARQRAQDGDGLVVLRHLEALPFCDQPKVTAEILTQLANPDLLELHPFTSAM